MRRANEPKFLADLNAVVDRHEQLREAHVRPADGIRGQASHIAPDRRRRARLRPVGWGTLARCLFLFEAPGARAVGSGFVSRNNPDPTAKNFWLLNREAALTRESTITWNVVPWYLGAGGRIRAARSADVRQALPHLAALLEQLPQLQSIVLLGRAAQSSGTHVKELRPGARVFCCPHPSARSLNARPQLRQQILDCLLDVRHHLQNYERRAL
jgi:uracil-DNA glycosylase